MRYQQTTGPDTLPAHPTISQGANYLNCSARHVRRLIAEGKLTAYRIGKRAIRLDRKSLIELGQPVGAASA
ncbi:MAG TPA: helix-turn-helix domain-containing protein [Mycobacterium sp.]|uniref:helix-turn-helix domain-containing protein n=1 Tax=Mycobacterium sp. TaxID=1785 RepID=UPI002D384EC4|nr:helix-turn-helix domain-containing protein [Mycobacterium sp.]HZU48703.1 helix-turn-helix domain-containing protein [Mycobacterium sp.]